MRPDAAKHPRAAPFADSTLILRNCLRTAVHHAGDAIADPITIAGAVEHARMAPLIAHTLLSSNREELSASQRDLLASVLRNAAATDAIRVTALRAALARLHQREVPTLVLKGLAHGALYPAPHLRPCNDADILVAAGHFDAASDVLTSLGYQRDVEVDAECITGQRHYQRHFGGLAHHIDLHSRALNPAAFASLPAFEELWTRKRPVGDLAFAPSAVDDLLLTCAHRVAHHPQDVDALWSLDVHLLASELGLAEWKALAERAVQCRMAAIVVAELERVRGDWETAIPDWFLAMLRGVDGEPCARYLSATSTLSAEWLNVRQQPSFRRSVAVVVQHVFPSTRYMRSRYGPANPLRLSWLYLQRAASGGARWVYEHRATRGHAQLKHRIHAGEAVRRQ